MPIDINTPTNGLDVIKLFGSEVRTPSTWLIVWKVALGLDKQAFELVLKNCEIASLREQMEESKPRKRCKVQQDLNERFITLAEIA